MQFEDDPMSEMSDITIPAVWLKELLELCGPEQHELRERVMASATPAIDAEAIKAEFLERTGQYLTNDASREACIAEAVTAEREACAKLCEGMHEEDRPHHYADAIRGRDPVPFVPLTTDGERLHFLLDQLTGWVDRTEEVNSYLHDEEGFPLDRRHALASIDAARAKAMAKESP